MQSPKSLDPPFRDRHEQLDIGHHLIVVIRGAISSRNLRVIWNEAGWIPRGLCHVSVVP
jgi:hypothetical protein